MPAKGRPSKKAGLQQEMPTAADHFQKMLLGSLGLDREGEQAREKYAMMPVEWVKDRLGEHLWSKQREIIESVRDNRHTAVRSCHTSGKSFLASRIAAWWLETHPVGESFVITTATTDNQVGGVVWRELRNLVAKAGLSGRTTMHNKWFMNTPHGNEIMVAQGVKPADSNPTALHGLHCKYMLVIIDEAAGFADPLWHAVDSLASSYHNRILAIGNPDFPTGEFVECFRPDSGWNQIHISAFHTPNFTGEEVPDELRHTLASKEWQEEKLRKWGKDNPLYMSKVLGEFPIVNEHGLIPVSWIYDAQKRWEAFTEHGFNPDEPTDLASVIGVDVGGGTDRSVIVHRKGPIVNSKDEWKTSNPNTMETLGLVMSVLKETEADVCHVDAIGIGQGIVDRAFDIATDQKEKSVSRKSRAGKIRGVKVGTEPKDKESYINLRAEAYWNLRERFQDKRIALNPDDVDLAAELADIQFKRTSKGQIQIESKADMKRRGKNSPDNADALMLAYCDPDVVKKMTKATWGRRPGQTRPGSVNTRPLRAPGPGKFGRR